jgi:hypothetical protein
MGGKKRRVEELQALPCAKYGMAAGVVKNIEGVTRCGVMCDGWPTWAIGAHLGHRSPQEGLSIGGYFNEK